MANDSLMGALEQNILTALCWNEELVELISYQLEAKHFSTRHYQKIAEVAIGHYGKHKKPIGPHLPDYLEADIRKSNGELFEFAIRDMENLKDALQIDFVRDELTKWIVLREVTRGLELASDAAQAGDLDTALDIMAEGALARRRYQTITILPTADTLLLKEFPDVSWDVEDYIPEGLTLISGPPKIGKSWMVLGVAIGACYGTLLLNKPVHPMGVLLLALEDNDRRLQRRLSAYGVKQQAKHPLHYVFEAPTLDQGLIGWLDAKLTDNPGVGLVIIDTLGMVKGESRKGETPYQHDVRGLRQLRLWAEERRVSLMIVHHNRKAKGDITEMPSGTYGTTGSVDTIIVMTREKPSVGGLQQARLQGIGRDLADPFDKMIELSKSGVWSVVDDYGQATPEKMENLCEKILKVMQDNDGPMRSINIAEKLHKEREAIDPYLSRMSREKPRPRVINVSRGLWMIWSGDVVPFSGGKGRQRSERE